MRKIKSMAKQLSSLRTWRLKPLKIGYPLYRHNQNIHSALKNVLFDHKTDSSSVDLISSTLQVDPSILTGETIPIENLYTRPKPQRLAGRQLFQEQYQWSKSLNLRWNVSDDSVKQVFYDEQYINHSYETSVQLWQGYEIVQFLKRFSNETWNPYYYSGLKPWEIVMDKFYGGENDYYDEIIKRALRQRKGVWTPQKDVQTQTDAETLSRLCAHVFFQSLDPVPESTGYPRFVRDQIHQKMVSSSVRDHHGLLLQKWHGLTHEQRQSYATDHIKTSNKFARDYCKMLMVLHYIYDVAGTGFDWRKMLSGSDYVYYRGAYLKSFIYMKQNRLQAVMFKDLVYK